MATRRDAFPDKEKATPSPQTGTAKLRGAVNQISPKPKVSTAPLKQTRPTALRTPTTGVSKPQTRKPASPATATKPAQTRTRPLDNKTAIPTLKARVSAAVAAATPVTATGVARRASRLPVKAVTPPKPPPAKKWKPVEKEEGNRRLSTSSVGSGRRSSIGLRKESVRSAPEKKERQITSCNLDKNEDLSICNVPEPEMKLQDIEYSYLNEVEEKTVQSLSNFGKGIDDIVRGDQEPLNFAKIENAINNTDPTVVIAGSSTNSGQHETPADIKTKENVTNSSDKVENIAENSHEEVREKEVKVVEVAAEEQAAIVSKVVESKEIEPAAEKKQQNSVPQIQQEKSHGKYDSPVSNDVIEETANKLREMRRNKVRALAGAFETVISLQEK
ncbi:hypothetical protein SASPL_101409 [Salvia splendens]|uniref:Calmodulin-binding domain-containing protein n=1 Tax=Salvia splendens TaxID=180675 RepID=A0A8X8YP82_SALSN|nr:uncharacterized protein LOC121743778 [Salvia splendens]KAG6436508.1 hypothetical protein SASPL_101409 [Salvia splendens]